MYAQASNWIPNLLFASLALTNPVVPPLILNKFLLSTIALGEVILKLLDVDVTPAMLTLSKFV